MTQPSTDTSTESTTQEAQGVQEGVGETTTRAPYGEPVSGGDPAPQEGQETSQGSDVQQLKEYLEGIVQCRQEAPKEEAEPSSEAPPKPTGGLNDLTPEDVGDPTLARFVQMLDLHYPTLDRDRAVGKAIEYGDASYIDEAYIREVAGDAAEFLIGYFEDAVNVYGQGVETALNNIYEMAGGKDRWQTIAQGFKSNAPESIRNVVKRLIDSNNPSEVQHGLEFIMEYATSTGLVDTPARRVGTSGGASGGDALSAQEFREELRKLGSRTRDPQGYDAAVTQLRKRRALGVELGL